MQIIILSVIVACLIGILACIRAETKARIHTDKLLTDMIFKLKDNNNIGSRKYKEEYRKKHDKIKSDYFHKLFGCCSGGCDP